jgi:4,4'-diaponeurosporenoate glycosyltransferase
VGEVYPLAFVILSWCVGWVLFADVRRFHPSPRSATPGRTPTISVIVPARNEALRLPHLLARLQISRARFELIVVDDGSSDGTGELARRAGATVVETEPPAGWTGKANAAWRGAEVATGEVLVFLDADTSPEPWFVDALADRAARAGGLVSVQPWHHIERAYEHLSAFCNAVAVLGAGTGSSGPSWWRPPFAFGPAVAVPRDVYLATGGHAASVVRGTVAEDLALARQLSHAGVPTESWAGGGIAYRMYPEGARSLWQGWTKNLAAGAGSAAPLRTLAVASWITGLLMAPTLVGAGAVGWCVLASVAFQVGVLLRRVGRFGVVDVLVYPALLVFFVGVFAVSLGRRAIGRGSLWRGRVVSTSNPGVS